MKLFLLIYMSGKLGGTIGPLPYGMDECMRNALALQQQAHTAAVTGKGARGNILTQKEIKRIGSMEFKCEYHDKRPKNDYP